MAENRLAIACAARGYIRMYAVGNDALDEIARKDILHEHSPIKSITGCESSGLFASLNHLNEIMVKPFRSTDADDKMSICIVSLALDSKQRSNSKDSLRCAVAVHRQFERSGRYSTRCQPTPLVRRRRRNRSKTDDCRLMILAF